MGLTAVEEEAAAVKVATAMVMATGTAMVTGSAPGLATKLMGQAQDRRRRTRQGSRWRRQKARA